jgi:hypothetical protein
MGGPSSLHNCARIPSRNSSAPHNECEQIRVKLVALTLSRTDAVTRLLIDAQTTPVPSYVRHGDAPARDGHELALLHLSRLLFLSFLETKAWLDGDRHFLANGFTRCMERGGSYHKGVMLPLFFGTLNTPVSARPPAARAIGAVPFLNGGLFAPAPLERRWPTLQITDASLGRAFGELFTRRHSR